MNIINGSVDLLFPIEKALKKIIKNQKISEDECLTKLNKRLKTVIKFAFSRREEWVNFCHQMESRYLNSHFSKLRWFVQGPDFFDHFKCLPIELQSKIITPVFLSVDRLKRLEALVHIIYDGISDVINKNKLSLIYRGHYGKWEKIEPLLEHINTYKIDLKKINLLPNLTHIDIGQIEHVTNLHEKLTSLEKLKTVTYSAYSPNYDELIETLKKIPHMTALNINSKEISADTLTKIKEFTSLKALSLPPEATIANSLGEMVSLTCLSLGMKKFNSNDVNNPTRALFFRSSSVITDDVLSNLQNLTALKQLNLSSTPITNKGLAHLTHLTALTDLNLSGCWNIDDGQPFPLSNLPLLKLKVDDCFQKFGFLTSLTSLTQLKISAKKIEKIFPHLTGLTSLQRLELRNATFDESSITHPCLQKLPMLTSLSFRYFMNDSLISKAFLGLPKLGLLIEASSDNYYIRKKNLSDMLGARKVLDLFGNLTIVDI